MKIFKLILTFTLILSIIGCESEPKEETASISGVTDVTVDFGSTFDPLDGVTATDSIDGAILSSEIVVSGTVDTNTSGTYTLTYTVTGSDGKEVTATRVVTVSEEPLECGDNREEVNGECVVVDQDLEDIKNALNETILLTNYQLVVLITNGDDSYEMTLSFDDQLALFEMGENDVVYYETTTSGIKAYIKQGDLYVVETVDQIEAFSFYEELDPKWFTKTGDYFLLGSQHISTISGMITDYMPDGAMNNFKVGLKDEYLEYFMFNVISGDETYLLTFTFDMIGEVDLELPTV